MPPALPTEFRVETLPDGVRYILPKPPYGSTRWGGVGFIVFGFAFVAFGLLWMWNVSGLDTGEFNVCILPIALLGLLPVYVGGSTIGLGLYLLTGWSEIELRGDRIGVVHRYYFLHLRDNHPLAELQRLNVHEPSSGVDLEGKRTKVPSLSDFAAHAGLYELRAAGDDIPTFILAPAYPPADLRALAADIATRRDSLISEDEAERPPIQIVETSAITNPEGVDEADDRK